MKTPCTWKRHSIGGADTRTVVLQNSRKNFLKKAKVETTNGVMIWEKGRHRFWNLTLEGAEL